MAKDFIRELCLRVKADCEDFQSPVPAPIRVWLHQSAKAIFYATYGLTPLSAGQILGGEILYDDPVTTRNWLRGKGYTP